MDYELIEAIVVCAWLSWPLVLDVIDCVKGPKGREDA